jgi:hypothetical protein
LHLTARNTSHFGLLQTFPRGEADSRAEPLVKPADYVSGDETDVRSGAKRVEETGRSGEAGLRAEPLVKGAEHFSGDETAQRFGSEATEMKDWWAR